MRVKKTDCWSGSVGKKEQLKACILDELVSFAASKITPWPSILRQRSPLKSGPRLKMHAQFFCMATSMDGSLKKVQSAWQ